MVEPLLVRYRSKGIWEQLDYHAHLEHYEIYFFHEGSCRYLIHNQIYDLEPGDILLMDGKTLHRANVQQDKEYIRSTCHFSPEWIYGVLSELKAFHLLEVFEKLHHCLIRSSENEESKLLEQLFKRLAILRDKYNLDDHSVVPEMKVLLVEILFTVNRLGQMDSRKLTTSKIEKEEHAENIAGYIQNNYKERLTLDQISENLNISKSYTSHVFKEMTGFTVMEYLMGCRLNQAKFLLEMEPSKPIKDVAFESGFESVSHFSRYFKLKVGVTAKEYQRSRLRLHS
ncbi:helix-turn-helix transcriptional regulator [Neobacillus dielmonensis]|uniref:helix-turn-helix transcriptional regulator n=1 Tax=Neobacillus dielmonensis TaxID=1347369 RepID=UPI000AA98911|nr:AraC family transcriptional regulator [Neobacillus dielmonensis]